MFAPDTLPAVDCHAFAFAQKAGEPPHEGNRLSAGGNTPVVDGERDELDAVRDTVGGLGREV